MIQSGRGAGFLVETVKPVRLRRGGRGQDFDRDLAPQPGIAHTIHFPHAAGSDRREDLIRSERCSVLECHGLRLSERIVTRLG